jgi:hypothetical protein
VSQGGSEAFSRLVQFTGEEESPSPDGCWWLRRPQNDALPGGTTDAVQGRSRLVSRRRRSLYPGGGGKKVVDAGRAKEMRDFCHRSIGGSSSTEITSIAAYEPCLLEGRVTTGKMSSQKTRAARKDVGGEGGKGLAWGQGAS